MITVKRQHSNLPEGHPTPEQISGLLSIVILYLYTKNDNSV